MNISEVQAKEVCKIGKRNECCRYLTLSPLGFRCAKHTELRSVLNAKVDRGEMVAQGDNCEGLTGAEVFKI